MNFLILILLQNQGFLPLKQLLYLGQEMPLKPDRAAKPAASRFVSDAERAAALQKYPPGLGSFLYGDRHFKNFLMETIGASDSFASKVAAMTQAAVHSRIFGAGRAIKEGVIRTENDLRRLLALPKLVYKSPNKMSDLVSVDNALNGIIGSCINHGVIAEVRDANGHLRRAKHDDFRQILGILESAARLGGGNALKVFAAAIRSRRTVIKSPAEMAWFYVQFQKLVYFCRKQAKRYRTGELPKTERGKRALMNQRLKVTGGFGMLALYAPEKLIECRAIASVPEFETYADKVMGQEWNAEKLGKLNNHRS